MPATMKRAVVARASMPWYMVVFILLFVAVLFFDFEHRQKQRFDNVNDQMQKLTHILRDQQQYNLRSPEAAAIKKSPVARQQPVAAQRSGGASRHRELSVVDYIGETSYTRGNNTNFFWPYAEQPSPENVYRFLGTTDVTALAEAVLKIPEEIWAEGDERSKKYKVHQYTSSIAFRLSGDHLREMGQKLEPFEGKKPTAEILNFDGSMEFNSHWPDYEPLIQPILDQIANTFPHNDRTWLRVLLVRLQAGKAVSTHRDNGCWMRTSRRIHVPVVTHDEVKFHASSTPKGVARTGNGFSSNDELLPVNTPGNIVELNNAMIHYVDNDAPIDRIHLIVDYMADMPNELTYDESLCVFTGDMQACDRSKS